MADRVLPTLLAPGTYWVLVVRYHDGSGPLGAYGPYPGRTTAEDHGKQLREAGIFEHEHWEAVPLRSIDLGTAVSVGRGANRRAVDDA